MVCTTGAASPWVFQLLVPGQCCAPDPSCGMQARPCSLLPLLWAQNAPRSKIEVLCPTMHSS
eukprot:346403-Amphidinium_carterae.1